MAPIAPNAVIHSTGPFLNPGDGAFNNGEEPRATPYVDHGGYIDLTNFQPVLDQHVHRWSPSTALPIMPEGWVFEQGFDIPGDGPIPTETANLYRLRGYLRGSVLPPGPQGQVVPDAAFELLATPWVMGRRTVIAVTMQTSSSPSPFSGSGQDQGYFGYEGEGWPCGIKQFGASFPPDTAFANAQVAVWAQDPNNLRSFEYNLLIGKCMPRTPGNDPVWYLQRAVQLVRAMQQIVQSPDASWRPPNWEQQTGALPVIAEGGSFGGQLAMWSAMMFPNDIHAAFAGGSPVSIRTYLGEQESHRYLQTLLGLGSESGRAHTPEKSFHFGHALWQYQQFVKSNGGGSGWDNWQPYFHTSITRAWRDGTLQRPVYFVFGDEDAVQSGTPTMARFDGIRGYHDHGQIMPSGGRTYVGWGVADRRCHQAGFHRTARGTDAHILLDDMMEFIDTVLTQPSPTAPVPFPPPAPAAASANEDPFDHVFTIPTFQQPAPQTVLFPDPQFGAGSHPANTPAGARRPGKAVGSGLWLGAYDSMIVKYGAIYVGSAEGVITKFVVNESGASPTLEPEAVGASAALGYGAWALAVGDVAPGAGEEIVVGTYRGLHVLSATPVNGVLPIVAQNTSLPWAHTRPHHLKIHDIVPGGQEEFAFASENGDLVVCGVAGSGVQQLWSYPEGGIIDLECLGSWEFALLSTRGHLVKIQRNMSPPAGQPDALLVASSSRLFGFPVDLEKSGDRLIVLQTNVLPAVLGQQATGHSLRAFDAATLADVTLPGASVGGLQFVTTEPNLIKPEGDEESDLEILPGGNFWVVMNNQMLFGIDANSGAVSFRRNLASYSTTAWTLDIAVGNVQSVLGGSNPWGDHPAEVVVATRSGYVTWLPLDCLFCNPQPSNVITQITAEPPGPIPPAYQVLVNQALDIPNNQLRRPAVPNGAPMLSSRTTSGSWGMTKWFDAGANKHWLELVDQAGSRWRMDPVNGDLTFQHELRRRWWVVDPVTSVTYSVSVPEVGPLRGIARVGTPAVGPIPPIQGDSNAWLNTQDFSVSVPGTIACRELVTHAFRPDYQGRFLNYGYGRWQNIEPQRLYVYDGFMVFPHGGSATSAVDVTAPPQTSQAHWWSGSDNNVAWPNLVEGAYFSTVGSVVQDWWATSRRSSAAFGLDLPALQISGNDLRDGFPLGLAQADAQSICVFPDVGASTVLIAVATAGGSALVFDPQLRNQISPWVSESQDFGSGGMALAVAEAIRVAVDDQVNSLADVYMGTLMFHGAATNHQSNAPQPDKMHGAVVWLEWNGSSLAQHMVKILDGSSANNPPAYGVCGIAVGDVIRNNNVKELVVTTMDGQLFVFERNSQGHVGQLLFSERLEGCVAPYNSLIVGDLDPNAPGEEIYIAGSLGVRKFRQP